MVHGLGLDRDTDSEKRFQHFQYCAVIEVSSIYHSGDDGIHYH